MKAKFFSTLSRIQKTYDNNLVLTISLLVLIIFALGLAVFMFFFAATPNVITITAGPVGSSYQTNAEKYKTILAKEGIKLIILPSEGSAENLNRLKAQKPKVDVGFVQSGMVQEDETTSNNLASLGSINYQPLMIFYSGDPKTLISEFKGQKIDIGQAGSGTRAIALTLLKANGIEPGGDTTLIDRTDPSPAIDLINGKIDALFLMGDSAPTSLLRQLLHTPNINLFNVTQADGYARRIDYLHKLTLPKGAIDFGKNIPSEDLSLIGPTVELVARKDLHPALSDALLDAAREVHSAPGLYRKRGEFPAVMEHDLPISPDAARFYTTGKSFLYRNFPFWLASLINRALAVIVPIGLLLIPGLRILPSIYRWRIQSRIYPWYRNLLEIERVAFKNAVTEKELDEQLSKLDHIELAVNKMKIPPSFGDLFYGLRVHISFVRERIIAIKNSGAN